MKKALFLLFAIALTTLTASAENWLMLSDGYYIDLESLKVENEILHLKVKANDIKNVNTILKTEVPGFMLDTNTVGSFYADMNVDCKTPKYFIQSASLYDKQNEQMFDSKSNAWETDMTKEDWAPFYEMCTLLKNNDKK